MRMVGGIIFIAGVLMFMLFLVGVRGTSADGALFGCLLMPVGILVGYWFGPKRATS
jgi:hypothetical protein